MPRRDCISERRPGTFDWILATDWPGSPEDWSEGRAASWSAGASGNAAGVELDSQAVALLVDEVTRTLVACSPLGRTVEVTSGPPALATLHEDVKTSEYWCLAPWGYDLRAWAVRFPKYRFYSGSLAHFSVAHRAAFAVVESLSPPAMRESRQTHERRLEQLVALVETGGRLVTRESLDGATSDRWVCHQAALAHGGAFVCQRHRLPDGSSLVVARRGPGFEPTCRKAVPAT